MVNHQSDGVNKLKRIEFVFSQKIYQFVLNPEEYRQTEPNRATPTQTKAGAWVDEFGGGIPTITFQGTTGFKNGSKDPTSGFTKFKELRDMLRAVYNRVSPGMTVPANKELLFYNYTDEEYWVVVPLAFELLRSVSRPTLYAYNVNLLCVRRIAEPGPGDMTSTFPLVTLSDFQL
jgi:hypothetical protein